MRKISLTKQLIYIILLIVGIIFISLVIILPKQLLPIYEENIYNKLKQPLTFIKNHNDIDSLNTFNETDIGYIYLINTDKVYVSNNINQVIKDFDINIIDHINNDYGKILYKNNIYYYFNTYNSKNEKVISITNDNYINNMKKDILHTILIVTSISFTLSTLIIIIWSNNLVNSIIILKKKIKNINNDNYNYSLNHEFDDEISSLDESIESMHDYLVKNEMYKNQLYQNISHDFKTPITVIKSYIEAAEDGIESKEQSFQIIKEQVNILENKVHSLLYLNKLNYLKEKEKKLKSKTNLKDIISLSVEKFQLVRPEINYKLEFNDNQIFRGTPDMWETIIDNLLNNFMRYTKKNIKITIKNNKITLFNDGEKIDEKIINNIFTPYEKGLNGMFGLGLSIVKKTLELLNYNISVTNVKNGVIFTIE